MNLHQDGDSDFWHFVQSALILRDNSQIKSLTLTLNHSWTRWSTGKINLITRVAAKYRVERLIIRLDHRFYYYDFGQDESKLSPLVFPRLLSETLVQLELDLGYTVELWAATRFTALKSLYLRRVRMLDNALENLFSSDCMCLENVHLDNVEVFDTDLVCVSACNLKNLTIVNVHDDGDGGYFSLNARLRICSPELMSFTYIGPMLHELTLQNAVSLEHSSVRILEHLVRLPSRAFTTMLNSLSHARSMTLSTLVVKMFSPRYGDESVCGTVKFNNLSCLKLEIRCNRDHIEGLINLLNLSPNVEALYVTIQEGKRISYHDEETFLRRETGKVILRGKPWKSRVVEEIPCLSKHVKTIRISYFDGSITALELVKFLLQNGGVLKKMEVLHWNKERKRTSSQKILAFPKASSEVVISFPDYSVEDFPWFDVGDSDDSNPEED